MAGSRAKRVITLAGLTIVYFAAGRFGLSLAIVNESASAVWPPTGIAVAALLLLGARAWPAIMAGAFLVNLTTSGVIGSSAAIAAGNTLEGLAAARLATRFARGQAAFDHPADIFRFTLVAAIISTTIAATIGTLSLVAARLAQWPDTGSIWLTWWLGDAVGMMLVAPLVLLWARQPIPRWTLAQLGEAIGLVACLLTVSFAVFGWLPGGIRPYPLEFLIVPVLLWTAFRFGARETATSAVIVAVVAIYGTLRGLGPFAQGSVNESLLLLQAFIGVTTTVMLAVAAEVARRRTMEMREQAARREAEQANRMKDRFLATLSHELRTPLNAALGWAHMLLELPRGDECVPRAIQAIYRNLLVQARLVSDIMDVSRATAGGLGLEWARVDLAGVVQSAIDTVRDAAAARHIAFQVTWPDEPVTLVGDARRLQQVVWNLLENAVKFSGNDSVVHLVVRQQCDAVEITVADSGPGIDPGFLPHVFDEFRQADDSVTREHGGLGLGLAIARHIVEQHGGTIDAVNRAGGGALFTVRLPAQVPTAAA